MSEFRAALDLDHRYCSLCAERAKPGRGKPVLIMRIGFFACFHAISLETQSFQQNRHVIFHVLIALAYLGRVQPDYLFVAQYIVEAKQVLYDGNNFAWR